MGMRLVWAGVGGVFAGFLICAFIVYPPHCDWGATIDWPAWVQAVGSILALVVAIAIPAWQNRSRKAEEDAKEHERARSLALLVLTDLQDVQRDMDAWHHRVDLDDDSLIRGNYLGFFDVPPALFAYRDKLYRLGNAAAAANDVVALLLLAHRELKRAIDIAFYPVQFQDETYDLDRVRHAAHRISARVDEALSRIGGMFGDPQGL